jgi:hypothetical protein
MFYLFIYYSYLQLEIIMLIYFNKKILQKYIIYLESVNEVNNILIVVNLQHII